MCRIAVLDDSYIAKKDSQEHQRVLFGNQSVKKQAEQTSELKNTSKMKHISLRVQQ